MWPFLSQSNVDRRNWRLEALFRIVSERSDWKGRHTKKKWRTPEVLLLTFGQR